MEGLLNDVKISGAVTSFVIQIWGSCDWSEQLAASRTFAGLEYVLGCI